MHLKSIHKQILKVILVALFVSTASSIFSQVVPATKGGGLPLSVGGGFSYWDVDWAHSKMEGYTLWADWRPPFLPHVLKDLSIEFEGRDISWNPGVERGSTFRETTGGGGVRYTWRHYRNIHPYFKGDIAFGGITFFIPSNPTYTHDTRTVYAPGGGIEYRAFRNIWARADYEYQFWPHLTGNTFLNPQGFTFGAMYDFRHTRRY